MGSVENVKSTYFLSLPGKQEIEFLFFKTQNLATMATAYSYMIFPNGFSCCFFHPSIHPSTSFLQVPAELVDSVLRITHEIDPDALDYLLNARVAAIAAASTQG